MKEVAKKTRKFSKTGKKLVNSKKWATNFQKSRKKSENPKNWQKIGK